MCWFLNGYLAVNGPVNISQLQSGELQNGTALTVGQGSIELSTGSDGFGQMVITGSGGIATNDYLVLKEGRIESYIYTASSGHVRYKEVRRTESGIGRHNQSVVIPAYFKSQPTINLYPRDITVYNADYPDQSQRLELYHSTPMHHGSIEGAWVFQNPMPDCCWRMAARRRPGTPFTRGAAIPPPLPEALWTR